MSATIPRFPIIAGLILSSYAVYVEYRHATEDPEADEDQHFQALCDIEALNASCSNVFALPQGRLLSYFGLVPEHSRLDLPNAALGVAHYLVLLLIRDNNNALLQAVVQGLVAVSFATTVFLAYTLTFVVPELCLLCWTTHVINAYVLYRCFFFTASSSSSSSTSNAKKTV